MSFPRYPKYKPSGVEWLGEVPEHWEVRQSRRLFACRNERAREGDEQLTASQEHGIVSQADFVRLEGRRVVEVIKGTDILKHVEPNDFVISMRSFQGGLEWSKVRGSISSAYVMLSSRARLHEPFFAYLFKCQRYIQALQTTTNLVRDGQAMRYHNFTQVELPVLPMAEQRAIAAFLDRETAKIDELIAEQEKLIELLAEKRQAAISHAVTKGLNPAAPMKPSGVEWLGDVPAHWQVLSLRRCIKSIEQGWSPECDGDNAAEGEWGVLKTGCTNYGVFNSLENKSLPPHLEPRLDLEVHEGDLLMSRASGSPNLVGSCAIVHRTQPRLMLSDKVFRLHTEQHTSRRFIAWALGSVPLRYQIERSISGADGLANNLPQSSLLGFSLALPPIREQESIADVLTTLETSGRRLVDGATQAIAILRERRSALISAAVTGQIDVRNAVPENAA